MSEDFDPRWEAQLDELATFFLGMMIAMFVGGVVFKALEVFGGIG